MENRYRAVKAKLKGREVNIIVDMSPKGDSERPYTILRNGHQHDPNGEGIGNILTWKSFVGAEMYAELLSKGSR